MYVYIYLVGSALPLNMAPCCSDLVLITPSVGEESKQTAAIGHQAELAVHAR